MAFDPEKITFFAKTDARGRQIPFGIKAKDRQRHMYVVGKTGMGKSTLLENMAAQDIQNGEGMAFIDPHGSAAETLLDYVPEHRINDVVYFAPFDLNNPVSFNVMEDVGPDKRHLVVSGLMSTFKKIWVDAWSARMEYILTNALLVLIEYPDTTLLSVNRLFSDKAYRTQVVNYCKDPAVKAFWTEEFANYTDRFAAEALPAIQNKIGQFTGNPLIRNIIGQPHSSFDIRKIMDEKKILIMNLSKGLVGETNANLLGSMLTTRIYLAAMSRADIPVAQMRTMPNFYFYVDEFQSFANATFANILSEARKYHLNLIIAHQYIEQMEEEVRDAVFGNVGTTVSFRVGPFDAEVLETVFTPRFLATDLVNLGFAQIYLTLMIDGIGSQPFSAVTLPPVEHPHMSCKGMVVAASRKNYTKERAEVEKIIADLHVPVKVEPPVKKPQATQAQSPQSQAQVTPRPAEATPVRPAVPNQTQTQKPAVNQVPPQTPRVAPVVVDIPPRQKSVHPERSRDGERPQPHQNKERDAKHKAMQPARTPEDLRSVLAKISQSESVKKSKIETEAPKTDKPEPSHLRSALADILKQVEPSQIKEAKPEVTKLHIVSQTKDVTHEEKIVVEEKTISTPLPVSESKDHQKAELERLAAEAEAAFSSLEQQPQPTVDDPLAAKKIERLFKEPTAQRSPFAS